MPTDTEPQISTPPTRWRRLSPAAWAGIAVTGVAALYIAYWTLAANRIDEAIRTWAAAQAERGLEVSFEGLDVDGFPLWLRANVAAPAVAGQRDDSAWRWQTLRLTLTARPWNLSRVMFDLSGHHELSLDWGNDQQMEFGATASRLSGAVERGGADGVFASFSVEAVGVTLPKSTDQPFGNHITAAGLWARIMEPVPAAPWPEALTGWRDGGGTLEIGRLYADYGPLKLDLDGTVALDADLQPEGAATARVTGAGEALTALRERGVIRPADAVTARLVLMALKKVPGAGGRQAVQLPVTLQDRILYAGPAALASLPQLRWK